MDIFDGVRTYVSEIDWRYFTELVFSGLTKGRH